MIVLPLREKIAKKTQFPEYVLNTLDIFYTIASTAHWQTPLSVQQTFPAIEIHKSGRMILTIAINYRLVIELNYKMQVIKIRFFDHIDKYDNIDPETV
ncbi:MAG TPA: type II toxin-antitoxin system HigB family toxin [Flavisolibacter sp.]|nr:type II toxin-antitoxin system HigB family toxin [Flavisolibacter sp.]